MFRTASKRKVRKALDNLTLPDPWDSRKLVEQIAHDRGHPIVLSPVLQHVMEGKVCGLWVSSDETDYLLYPEDSPSWHIDIVICHELGHMLLDHDLEIPVPAKSGPPTTSIDIEGLSAWLPGLDPDAVRGILGRSGFSARSEYEAEYLATLIIDRAVGDIQDTRHTRMLNTFVRGEDG